MDEIEQKTEIMITQSADGSVSVHSAWNNAKIGIDAFNTNDVILITNTAVGTKAPDKMRYNKGEECNNKKIAWHTEA